MDRRHFMSLAAAVGLTGLVPLLTRTGDAVAQDSELKHFIIVTANGGWDPRFHFDPSLDTATNRIYTDIDTAGNIQYATWEPGPGKFEIGDDSTDHTYLLSPGAFIQKWGNRFTVLNGVDTSTNNHDTGKRTMNSGFNPEGYPALGALAAAKYGADLPMAFYSGGSYDATAGLVPLTRINSADSARRIAKPSIVNPQDPGAEQRGYHTAATWGLIRKAQEERMAELGAGQHLPKLKGSIEDLRAARAKDNLLARLALPDEEVDFPLNDLEGMVRQAQVAIAGFESGLTAAANINLGGFDTHSNHDSRQPNRLGKLFFGIDWIMTELEAKGLLANTYVLVVSDFARTPQYNGTNNNSGKDHWPVTTALVTGPGVEGGRVIGGTTPDQKARKVNPNDPTKIDDDNGVKITPGALHKELRRLAGVPEELLARFPLEGDDVKLFA